MAIIKTIRKIYRYCVPQKVRDVNTKIYFILLKTYYRRKILSFLYNQGLEKNEGDKLEVFNYLKNNKLSVFPGSFQDKYLEMDVDVRHNNELDLNYVIFNDKKLYFKRGMSVSKIVKMIRGLSIEQDEDSPHRYFTDKFAINDNDIVYDVGAAEGSLGLNDIEKVSKLFIFEPDPLWAEAIEATYHPWKEKVTIVNSYVTSKSKAGCISLDEFISKNDPPDLIKIDVDGEEMNLLNGFKYNLKRSDTKLKILICTYHKQNDEIEIGNFLREYEFENEISKGYMLFYFDKNFVPPYLRRGLIRSMKK